MKQHLLKQTDPKAAVYEAVGKMILGNAANGQNVNPALGLLGRVAGMGEDPEYEQLLEKPLWQFTGKDHAYMIKHILMESFSSEEAEPSSQKRYVYGYQGIASLFGCSKSTAQRIKKSGVIDDAITQVKRKITVDADLALQLAKESGLKLNEP